MIKIRMMLPIIIIDGKSGGVIMKVNKNIMILLSAILLIVCVAMGSMFLCKNRSGFSDVDVSNLPIYEMRGTFVYDICDIRESVGIVDYVFVARVVNNDGTTYEDIVVMEDENCRPKEVGTPYTHYTVQVIDNIKGKLQTKTTIKIAKQGGVMQEKNGVFLFENDILPEVGQIYVFLAYAQPDGSLLISGPDSNVLIEGTDGPLSEQALELDLNETYKSYVTAYENEIIPVKRERYISDYED